MKPKTKGLTAAVTGTALGIGGLAVLAMPADAGDEPTLPPISAEELVASTLSAEPPAFAGTVAVDNNLGLPQLPGMDALGIDSARVYHDGDRRGRISVQRGSAEQTVVHNAEDGVWTYDSDKNTATHYTLPAEASELHEIPRDKALADPATAATEAINKLQETSIISVDGTARIADRPAYELVLTPKPDERTLIREVKVAIDSETRLPLRFQVLPNGSADPVLSVGFSDLSFGDQPDELFSFTPPQGTEVVEKDVSKDHADGTDKRKPTEKDIEAAANAFTLVGDGWDTVVTGTVPAEALSAPETRGGDPRAMLEQVGERVTGEFGSGYVITTRAGTGLLTDDGRFAAGLVPQQVLIDALEKK